MTRTQLHLLHATRRHFFSQCFVGLGGLALADLLSPTGLHAAPGTVSERPLAPKRPHFAPKVKRVVYLFMS
ncbi:MAG: sulfatase, partial [Acidobacteriia bacterium]|nr:sulfatase [Terriglobia bacterium]